ncbi:MAG: hypothetical protein IT529_11560 [Burkholderiales bacterium]|nr:hypothetical protein [Burkholderiales bacterium]
MNQPPDQSSPRQRLQALLAIPERQRTDEQWDEINELEILLAPANRIGAPQPVSRLNLGQNQNQNPNRNQPGRHHHPKQKRWSRGRKPGGGGGGGSGGGR